VNQQHTKGSLDDETDELSAAIKVLSLLADLLDEEADKETAGIAVATGMAGVDLAAGDEEDEDDDERAEKLATSLRMWQKNAQNRLRLGRPPHRFVSLDIPGDVSDAVWAGVSKATTRAEIDRIFKSADPKASPRPEPGAAKGQTVDAAGIAVVAKDTGRVLMIQRDFDDKEKQGAGRWEWPGGRLEDGEDPWTAAKREWEEETGNELPKGETLTTWAHDNYVCFIYRIAKEDAIHLNPDRENMEVVDPDHPKAEMTEVAAWWRVKDAKHSDDALRDEFKDFEWDLLEKGSPDPQDFAEYRNRIYSAQMDELRKAGVQKIAWKGGTCKRCQVNKAASPIDINEFWPDGPPPLHGDCGCSVVPAK
jgi:8-oxo-dGTP pyrophosphatase MutT (NUDIX family)